MADNDGRLLGIFDELSSFLTKITVFNGKSICDSNELSMLLELYNGNAWSRNTGKLFTKAFKFVSYCLVNNSYI